jgi:hypothetical protein
MRRRWPSPATPLALIALFLALGGTGYAASSGVGPFDGARSSHHRSTAAERHLRGARGQRGPAGAQGPAGATGARGPRGPAGTPGETGAQGTGGPQGPAGTPGATGAPGTPGQPGTPGDARAYALVEPACSGCGELPPGFTALNAARSKNVALASPERADGTPPGTWCFILEGGIDPASATVITSPVYSEEPRGADVAALWLPYASDCEPGQIEIKTFMYTVKEGKLVREDGIAVPFSFVVP